MHEAARESSRGRLIKQGKTHSVFNLVLLSDMHLPDSEAIRAVLRFAPPVTAFTEVTRGFCCLPVHWEEGPRLELLSSGVVPMPREEGY